MRIQSLLAVTVLLVGCEHALSSEGGSLLGTDVDPAEFTFSDSVAYSCRQWYPAEPEVELGLFDLRWSARTEDELATEGATVEQRAVVERRGGRIVQDFHLPMSRVVLPPVAVREMEVADRILSKARGVIDPGDFPVRVTIVYRLAPNATDVTDLERVGATNVNRHDQLDAIVATVQDSVVPTVRDFENVQAVYEIGVLCLDI